MTADKNRISKISLVPINKDSDVDSKNFKSDNPKLNSFLKEEAYYEHIKKLSSTHLIYSGKVLVGYFTTRVTTIKPDNFDTFGTLELKNLCIDSRYQRKGVGTAILEYIVEQTIELVDFTGIRFLTLHALKEKCEWYKSRGFEYFDESKIKSRNESTILMYMDFQDIDELKLMFEE